MLKKYTRTCWQVFFLFICGSCLPAQNKSKQHGDSALVKRYFGRAFQLPLYSQARQLTLDSILVLQHDNAYAWQQKGMPLYKQKKYELGAPFLDSAVKFDKGYQWTEYRAFMKCVFQKTYRAALVDLYASEKMNPGGVVMDHSYDFWKGLCYLQLNRFDSAVYFIDRSIAAGIKRIRYGHHLEYLYLGICKMEQDKNFEAMLAFDKGLEHYARFSDIKYYKALCLKRLNKEAESIALLRDALVDLRAGYTINEDNVIYEEYPYQIREYWIRDRLEK